MKFYSSLSGFTKKLIITTICLLLYGYLCRTLAIYFFWESRTIGWTLFALTLIFILRDIIKLRKLKGKKTILQKFLILFPAITIIAQVILLFVIPQTDAYDTAVNFIRSNPEIQSITGPIKNVVVLPIGSMSTTSSSQGTEGLATLVFIVKGSNKYKDVDLKLSKQLNSDWRIDMMRW